MRLNQIYAMIVCVMAAGVAMAQTNKMAPVVIDWDAPAKPVRVEPVTAQTVVVQVPDVQVVSDVVIEPNGFEEVVIEKTEPAKAEPVKPVQKQTYASKMAEARTPFSVLVCRSKQCAKAEYSMTKEFLYNKLVGLFENNLNKDILMCDADPLSRVCYNEGIVLPAQTNLIPAQVKLSSAKVLDAKLIGGQNSLDLILDYNIDINNIRSVCQSAVTRLNVDFIDKVQMQSPGFDCRFTTTGSSGLNATYNIDYVDFDYGTIGAYYVIGVGESVRGGSSGYVLMRFADVK